MALVKCPECKHSVSETAKSCPQCGYEDLQKKVQAGKVERPMSGGHKAGIGCGVVVAIVLALLFFLFLLIGFAENMKRERAIYGARDPEVTENQMPTSLVAVDCLLKPLINTDEHG